MFSCLCVLRETSDHRSQNSISNWNCFFNDTQQNPRFVSHVMSHVTACQLKVSYHNTCQWCHTWSIISYFISHHMSHYLSCSPACRRPAPRLTDYYSPLSYRGLKTRKNQNTAIIFFWYDVICRGLPGFGFNSFFLVKSEISVACRYSPRYNPEV